MDLPLAVQTAPLEALVACRGHLERQLQTIAKGIDVAN